MNINRLALMLLLLLVACSNSFAQRISHEELVEILGIRTWRVPLPKDEKLGWSVKIINYEFRTPSNPNNEKFDLQNNALIVVREIGKDTYQFILKLRNKTTRGEFEIQTCSEKKGAGTRCENRYEIEWYQIPMPVGDGQKFVIADITGESNKPVKHIILEPSLSGAEDRLKERSSP